MNSLPRWLISITDMPLPRQSSISSPARARTSAGSIAGPALKLKMRDISEPWVEELPAGAARSCESPLPPFPFPVAAVAVAQVALLDALEAG